MATQVTATEHAPRSDPREVGQERAFGTVDLDTNGAGSVTVDLSGELSERGLGLITAVTADDGTASLSALSPDSATVDVSGGTADATDVGWELVISEDGYAQ